MMKAGVRLAAELIHIETSLGSACVCVRCVWGNMECADDDDDEEEEEEIEEEEDEEEKEEAGSGIELDIMHVPSLFRLKSDRA